MWINLEPVVIFVGNTVTIEASDRVLMSFVTNGIAKSSSNIPGGGVGAS